MAWIDYKKAYDSIRHEWLIKSLNLHQFDTKIVNLIEKTMLSWKTTLHIQTNTQNIETDEININAGVFQVDSTEMLDTKSEIIKPILITSSAIYSLLTI